MPPSSLDASDDGASIIAAAARGDEAAWRELVHRYSRRVFALARSRCGSVELAEEVTQSVFASVAVVMRGGRYSEQGRFESWLFRIAMNRIRDEVRRSRRQARAADPETLTWVASTNEGPAGAMESATSGQHELHRLRMALERLSDQDREIIELRHHGAMSFKQMADQLGEPLGTLLARHHRALRKLKEIMGDAEGDSSLGVQS